MESKTHPVIGQALLMKKHQRPHGFIKDGTKKEEEKAVEEVILG